MNIRTKFLYAVLASSFFLTGCPKNTPDSLQAQMAALPAGQPMVLAAYQPWFGTPSHINVGYSSVDRVALQKQIEQAKNLGISGFVVNWYGPQKAFEDRSYALLQQLAGESNFHVALMYDEPEDRQNATDETIHDLQYAYDNYLGPTAKVPQGSYITFNGRPVIFIFPKGGKTDWKRVKEATSSWQAQPLLIYENANPREAAYLDGFFAWVNPGRKGWNSDDWGQDYLDDFYSRMKNKYPDKIAVGAAWPGFDDSRASWRRNRHMPARCGKTFEDSLRHFRKFYDENHPLPFLMIVTWNDYEEGTAIEGGLPKC